MEVFYTEGFELYTEKGESYVGPYVLDDSNYAYKYIKNVKHLERLYSSTAYNVELVRNTIKNKGGYATPIAYRPSPSHYEYKLGYIYRYFVQKRVSPVNTIVEISEDQYGKVGPIQSSTALNSSIYNDIKIRWAISGKKSHVYDFNFRQVKENLPKFIGLNKYIKDYYQFFRAH